MKYIRNAWLRKYYCRKLDNNKLKYDNHAITKYSISSQIKIETLHDQKYYCRKLNNNKLKYDNHAITKYSILKSNENWIFIFQKYSCYNWFTCIPNDSLNKIKYNSSTNVFLNKGNDFIRLQINKQN